MTTSLFGLIDHDFKSQVVLRWHMPVNESMFSEFAKIGEIEDQDIDANAEETAMVLNIGPVLSDIDKPTHVISATCIKDQNELFWFVREWSAPSEPPPEEILESSKKAGNYSNVCEMIASIFSTPQQVGTYSIKVYLPEPDGWQCKLFLKAEIPDELIDLGSVAHNEEVGYRFEGGTSGLEEFSITYDHSDKDFIVDIRARAILEVESKDGSLLSTPNNLTQLILNRAFVRVE